MLLKDKELGKIIASVPRVEVPHSIALAQARKDIEWGDEWCREHGEALHGHEVYRRHECPDCWKAHKEEVGQGITS